MEGEEEGRIEKEGDGREGMEERGGMKRGEGREGRGCKRGNGI